MSALLLILGIVPIVAGICLLRKTEAMRQQEASPYYRRLASKRQVR